RDSVEVILLVQGFLFDVRKQVDTPGVCHGRGPRRRTGRLVIPRTRELTVRVVIAMLGQPDLFEVVAALHAVGRFANLLDSGEQQTNKDRDNRDHDQQLDQRESVSALDHNEPPKQRKRRRAMPDVTMTTSQHGCTIDYSVARRGRKEKASCTAHEASSGS